MRRFRAVIGLAGGLHLPAVTTEVKREDTGAMQKCCGSMIFGADSNEKKRLVEIYTTNGQASFSRNAGSMKR